MLQPNTPATSQTDTTAKKHNALRILWIYLGAVSLTIPVYLYLILFQTNAWQLFALLANSLGMIVVTVIAYQLVQRDRINQAMALLISGIMVAANVVASTVAGIGLVLGLITVLITLSIAVQTLSQKGVNWVIITGFAAGILAALFELWAPAIQLNVPAIQTFISIVAVLVTVIYVGFIFWQFKSYNLATKLLVAFLLIALIPLSIVAGVDSQISRTTLSDEIGLKLNDLAKSQALTIGNLLSHQIDLLDILASNQILETKLKTINATYKDDDPATIRNQIARLDQQWRDAPDSDLIVHNVLRDILSEEFRRFRKDFFNHAEIFVTDRYGALVAATNRPSDYDQSDEEWWQTAYSNGQGAVYISQPGFDESSNTFAINIAVPIYDSESQAVLGILRSTYSVAALIGLMASVKPAEIDRVDLIFPNNITLSEKEASLVPISEETIAQLQAHQAEPYQEITSDDTVTLVSQAPIRTFTDQSVVANLGWLLVIHQSKQLALAPVESQIRLILLLALIIAGVVAAAAVGIAQILSTPITRLTATVLQISAGDLNKQAEVDSDDEIGKLALTFNAMTRQLRETIDTLGQRMSERTQQLETVVDISRQLASILDLSDLLRKVVTLTKETFGYDQVHIYLLDGAAEALVLTESYEAADMEFDPRGQIIPLTAAGNPVARAAYEGRIVRTENISEDSLWQPNLQPDKICTQIAVPISLGREVVGVLDVYSTRLEDLTDSNETTLQALANYVAIAVRNARVFTETQDALYQAQRLQRLYTSQAWAQFTTTHPTTMYEFRQPSASPLVDTSTPEITAVLQKGQTVTLKLAEAKNGTNGHASPGLATNLPPNETITPDKSSQVDDIEQSRLALATPLSLGHQIIGVLGIRDDNPERRWTKEEIALIEAVSEQMSLAIENARLFNETQKRAGREALTRQITDKIRNASTIEAILQTTVTELSNALGVSNTFIDLGSKAKR